MRKSTVYVFDKLLPWPNTLQLYMIHRMYIPSSSLPYLPHFSHSTSLPYSPHNGSLSPDTCSDNDGCDWTDPLWSRSPVPSVHTKTERRWIVGHSQSTKKRTHYKHMHTSQSCTMSCKHISCHFLAIISVAAVIIDSNKMIKFMKWSYTTDDTWSDIKTICSCSEEGLQSTLQWEMLLREQ